MTASMTRNPCRRRSHDAAGKILTICGRHRHRHSWLVGTGHGGVTAALLRHTFQQLAHERVRLMPQLLVRHVGLETSRQGGLPNRATLTLRSPHITAGYSLHSAQVLSDTVASQVADRYPVRYANRDRGRSSASPYSPRFDTMSLRKHMARRTRRIWHGGMAYVWMPVSSEEDVRVMPEAGAEYGW